MRRRRRVPRAWIYITDRPLPWWRRARLRLRGPVERIWLDDESD